MKGPIESVTKQVYNISDFLQLKIKVMLGSKDQNGRRKKFIDTYEFTSTKYTDSSDLVSMNISTKDYLILETRIDYNTRMMNPNVKTKSILLTYENIHMLIIAVNKAYSWLTSDFDKVYRLNNGRLELADMSNVPVAICDTGNKNEWSFCKIVFSPTIRVNKEDRTMEAAVMVSFGDNGSQIGSLSFDELASLVYFFNNFNLLDTSLSIVNQSLMAMSIMTK